MLDHLKPPSVTVEISAKGVLASFFADKSPQTLRAYKKDLSDFRAFLRVENTEEACSALFQQSQGAANALVQSYKNHLKERGLSSATQNRRLAAIKSVWRLALLVGLVPFPLSVKGSKEERLKDTRGPGKDGVLLMLGELAGRSDPKALRDRALLRLMFDLALRRGEVLSLEVEHIQVWQRTVAILGKGRESRQVMRLPQVTADALGEWLRVRGDHRGALFLRVDKMGNFGERLSERGLYQMVSLLGKKVGLQVRPHGLRHAAITAALDATNDVRMVQRYSRHADLKTLIKYDDARKDFAGEVAELVSR